MKPTQAALLLGILVVMVFAVTFASMYVREKPAKQSQEEESQERGAQLTFDSTRVPERLDGNAQRVVTEFGKKGHQDFWFRNSNDEAVTVGLTDKNCACSNVKVFVGPREWRAALDDAEARRLRLKTYVGSLSGGLGSPGRKLAQTRLLDLAHAELITGVADEDFKSLAGDPKGITVPARAVGVVRLEWEFRRENASVHPRSLGARLWMQSPKMGGDALGVATLGVDPILLDQDEVAFGPLDAGDAKEVVVYCWSLTRPSFTLETRSSRAPFIHCEVEKVPQREWRMQSKTLGPVMAGYRVTISMRERLDEKKRLDEGPFEHRVDLVPLDGTKKLAPLHVNLRGTVRGDIVVHAARSSIELEPFPARRGTHREVTLSTQQPDLDLKVDSHPPFMKVALTKEKTGATPSWKLHLEIGSDRVAGSFPRPDNDTYKDTAIYLKISGEGSRRLRIPVSGTATQ